MSFETKSSKPDKPASALSDLKVLDLATFIAGPYCATFLAEFGADVVKVELTDIGDPVRKFGTPTNCGDSLLWLSEGRNKRSIELDLRSTEGSSILKKLVAEADVLCENFQVGTLEKWGLGEDVLLSINPSLIIARITAYGQTGPYKGRPGFGRIANAFSGISYLCGDPDSPPASPGTATLSDYMSGVFAALGVLVSVHHRKKTGEGQVVDIGLYESIFRILDELAPAYAFNGFVRRRMGPGTVNAVPHSHYPTSDGLWVAIACTNDKIFNRLAKLMDRLDVTGEGDFGTIEKREQHRSKVDAFVTHWTSGMTRSRLLEICEAAEVPCGPIYSIDEIFEDPQYVSRENLVTLIDQRAGSVTVPNVCPRLSKTPGKVEWLGRKLGADTDAVLHDWLG